MTRTNTCLVFVALSALALAACGGSQSRYQRTTANHGELVWAFDGELTVTQNGVVVSDDSWDGLSDALTCVPRAAALADEARGQRSRGIWLAVLGGAAGAAVLAAGTYVAIDKDTATGLGMIGGGTGLALGTVLPGAMMVGHAKAKGVDSVNIYNDRYGQVAACANR